MTKKKTDTTPQNVDEVGNWVPRSRKALRGAGHEYSCVARTTRDPMLMIEANETSISKGDAEALAELMADDCGRARRKITWGKRAWAKPNENRIHLPEQGCCLNAGIVLHEFAHLVAPESPLVAGRYRHHDAGFVAALDKLLVESSALSRSQDFKLESCLGRIEETENRRSTVNVSERKARMVSMLLPVLEKLRKGSGKRTATPG